MIHALPEQAASPNTPEYLSESGAELFGPDNDDADEVEAGKEDHTGDGPFA